MIGKQIREGMEYKNVILFDLVGGNVPIYDEDFINSLNNDAQLFYEFCHAIMSGNFSQELAERIIGHVHQAR